MTGARIRRAWTATFLGPGVGLTVAFVLVPILVTVWLSLTEWSMYGPLSDARWVGLDNYRDVFGNPQFRQALWNTVVYTLLTIALLVPLSFGLGLFVYRVAIRGATLMRVVLFSTYMVPTVAVAIVWGYLYSPLYGPLNQVLGAVGIGRLSWLGHPATALVSLVLLNLWQMTGYFTVLMIAGLTQIPGELYEAAEVDGAGPLRRTLHVTLPMMRRTLVFVLVIVVINAVQVFDPVYVLTQGGPSNATNVLSFEIYRTAFDFGAAGRASAMAVVLLALLVAAVGGIFRLGGEATA